MTKRSRSRKRGGRMELAVLGPEEIERVRSVLGARALAHPEEAERARKFFTGPLDNARFGNKVGLGRKKRAGQRKKRMMPNGGWIWA
jgi:hypothetical protein